MATSTTTTSDASTARKPAPSTATTSPSSSRASTAVVNARDAEKCGYAWVILVSSFILRVIIFGQLFSTGVLYVHWLDEFKKTRGQTAWIGSIASGTTLLMGEFSKPSGFSCLRFLSSIQFLV